MSHACINIKRINISVIYFTDMCIHVHCKFKDECTSVSHIQSINTQTCGVRILCVVVHVQLCDNLTISI